MELGFIDGMSMAEYRAAQALSKSGVGPLVDKCPDAYWWESPFNPEYEREESHTFDIGTAAHLVILEPDQFSKRTVLVQYDNYRTDAAKERRDEAYQFGLTPVLEDERAELLAMRATLMRHPLAKNAFRSGIAERSHFWQDEATGVWCKCRPDFQSADGRYVVDYKTAANANPRDFRKAMRDHYYFVQQPWYLEGIRATTGATPNFLFVVQEKKAPYRVSVIQLEPSDAEKGRVYARKARHVFAECLKRGNWPGYTDRKVATIGLPNGFQYEFAEREEAGEFETAVKRRFNSRTHRIHYEAQIGEGVTL